jgi:endonuclease VIII
MEGSWRIYRRGRRWTGGPEHQIRAILGNQQWTAVGYRLAIVELLRTDAESEAIGHLGPDVLGADWDVDEAVRRLCEAPERTVGEALLDQRNLAGIGNLYKSELCFLAGHHPRTPVGAVDDLDRIVDRAHRMLFLNRDRVEQATTGDLRRGRQHWVYRRDRQPCRRCGTRILVDQQGPEGQERTTYWCPTCQRSQ